MENQEQKTAFDLFGASKAFAIRSIKLYQYLTESSEHNTSKGKSTSKSLLPEYSLSKMFLLAGTRIGDDLRQDNNLDAYHHAKSAKYWLDLLQGGGYIDQTQAESMLNDCLPLVKILYVRSHPDYYKDKAAKEGGAA